MDKEIKLDYYKQFYEIINENPPIFIVNKDFKPEKDSLEKNKRVCVHCGKDMNEIICLVLLDDCTTKTFHRIVCIDCKTPNFIYVVR